MVSACAVHSDVPAKAPCGRCGAYACAACLSATIWGSELCAECIERVGEQGQLPWEMSTSGSVWQRFVATSWQVMRHPSRTFATLGPGSTRAALRYFLCVSLAVFVLSTGAHFAAAPHMPKGPIQWFVAFGTVPLNLLSFCAIFAAYAGTCALLGGRLPVMVTLRACFYMQGLDLWFAPASLLGALFQGLGLKGTRELGSLLVTVASFAVYGRAIWAYTRRRQQLSTGRSSVALMVYLAANLFLLLVTVAIVAALQMSFNLDMD